MVCIWETGIQQQTKPTLSFQVGLLRAIITWLQENVKSCQSSLNSHLIYWFLEPLSSPQASFSLIFLPSATSICFPGTLHCCSDGWWAPLAIKSPTFFAARPRLWRAYYKQHKLSPVLIPLSHPPTTELQSC